LDEIAAGGARSLEQEVFARLSAGSLAALSGRYRFIDIGTPDSLARAAEVLVRPPVPRSSRGLRRS
jgi:mannose-1-phosphate guanylyltransferase